MALRVDKIVTYLFFLLVSYSAYAQTGCSCPPLNTCFACSGGLTYLKMEYTNSGIITDMTASDNDGVLPSTFQNEEITINSRTTGQPFNGDVIIIVTKFNGNTDDVSISSSCSSPLFVGDHIRNFQVVEGASVAGPICCSDSKMDHVAPSLSACPSDVFVSATPGGCTAPATWTPPTATDNCGNVTLTTTHQIGSAFQVGTTLVTYTATDDFNNTRSCSFNVTVTDNSAPVITNCPSDISINADGSDCEALANWIEPIASDCALTSFTSNLTSGSRFPIGNTTVIYTATDASGKTASCSFIITVADKTAPVFAACPNSINILTDQSCTAIAEWTIPTATDNCTMSSLTSTHTSGSSFPIGISTVTYTAIDASGNKATCSFTVTITDKSAPTFVACPTSINIIADQSCIAIAEWTTPTATDNCTMSSLTSTHTSGSSFPVGISTVTYTATDVSGNKATCNFTVTVTDKSAPTFVNCPMSIHMIADQSCTAVAEWTIPTAIDNCSDVNITSTHQPKSTFPVGITTVTYTATDLAGNASQCQFEVVVTGSNSIFTNCPSDITIDANESGEVIVNWKEPNVTSSCGSGPFTSSHSPGDSFPIGTTTVVYTIQGGIENANICQFNIVVLPAPTNPDFEVILIVTPDGDGINDYWQLPNIEQFEDNKVILLDRWGGLIYEASGYNNGSISWNGANTKGGQVPSGTYFYSITVHYESREVKKKGFIELIR